MHVQKRPALAFTWLLLFAGLQPLFAEQQPTPAQPQPVPQPGQAGQPAPYSLQVSSQLVVLDVVVTDKQGNIVTNLTKDDFLVTEDNAPQTIRTLERPGAEIPSAAPAISSTAELDKLEPRAPVSIIVLGEGTTSFNDQAYARYSLKQYLKAQGDTLTQPVMLVAADNQHFMVLRDYTTSRQEILSALDRHFANPPWGPMNSNSGQRLAATLLTLMTVAQATAGHPGHKNMIWIGNNNRIGARVSAMDPQRAKAVEDAFKTCTNLLRDSRVTLYTLDPGGVGSDTVEADYGFQVTDPFAGVVTFNTVAAATGGKAFRNHNDVDTMIGTSLRDGINFYTLTYVPSTPRTDDSFRAIKVQMKDKNLTATTREGYFARSPALPSIKTASGALDKRLIMDINVAGKTMMVYDGMPLTLARDAAAPDKFVLHLQVPDTAPTIAADGKQAPDLTLLVQSFDRKGKMLARDSRFVTLHGGGSGSAQTRIVDYPVTVATAAPVARIRFVVRDNASGKVAADNFFLVDRNTLSDPASGLNPEKMKP